MFIQVTGFIDLEAKVKALDCFMPTGVAVIPASFQCADTKESIYYMGSDLDLRSHLREKGVPGTSLEDENEAVQVHLQENIAPEWLPPLIFIGEKLISENSPVIQLAIGVISSYLYDMLKKFRNLNQQSTSEIEFSIVCLGKDGTYKKVSYKGPSEKMCLEEVYKMVAKIGKD